MSDDRHIRGCDLRHAFDCPRRWAALPGAPGDEVRSCPVCSDEVVRADSLEAAERALADGKRVAVFGPEQADWERQPARENSCGPCPADDCLPLSRELAGVIPYPVATRLRAVPIGICGPCLVVAASSVSAALALELRTLTGKPVELVSASEPAIARALAFYARF